MEEEIKQEKKKRLSLDATMLLTIGGVALAVVVYGIVRFVINMF